MQYTETAPHPALAGYIDAYWSASGNAAHTVVEKILPDGCVDIIMNAGADCYTDNGSVLMKHEKAYLVGTMTRSKETAMDKNTRLIGVRFKPGAVTAFFGKMPLQELVNKTVELDAFLAIDTCQLLASPATWLDDWLYKKFKGPDERLLSQVRSIQQSKGQVTIKKLAAQHCTTPRQLERGFRQQLGITPKDFASLVRCQQATAAIEKRKAGETLLSIALEYGYYDHAHLTNAFTWYNGCTPSEF